MSTLLTYPRIVGVSDPHGCSLTAATITALTPDKIEAFDHIEYNQERIFARIQEARAVGVTPNALYDLLTSRITTIGKERLAQKNTGGKQSLIAPFLYRKRERNYAVPYFAIASGAANSHAGETYGGITYPNSAWDIVINLGPSPFASAIQHPYRYFLPGNYLVIEWHDGVAAPANVAYTTTHRIVAVADTSSSTATITLAAPFTAAGWTALSGGDKTKWQPTFGTVQLMANNVSDWESWCYNQPVENNKELIVDWFQTSRFSRCRTDEYMRMLTEILKGNVNQYIKEFRYLEETKRNAMEMRAYDQQWLNTLWFGQRISEHQTVDPVWDDIEALEQVVDPEDPSCVYEYKANCLGVQTQLAENGRVIDMRGAALDLDAIFALGYTMRRNRQLDGKSHDKIDLMTDRYSKDIIDRAMITYLKGHYGYDIVKYVEKGKLLDDLGQVAFEYTCYDVPREGFQIAVFTHAYFDDRILAFGDGTGGTNGGVDNKARSRQIWSVDFSDMNIGVLETNSVKREYKGKVTAEANEMYSCRMKLNTKHYDLRSTTYCLQMGDYNRHMLVQNFSSEDATVGAEE